MSTQIKELNIESVKQLCPTGVDIILEPLVFDGFEEVGGYYNRFKRIIKVANGKSREETTNSLLHEIAHAICHRNHCACFTDKSLGDYGSAVLKELHAFQFTVYHIQEHITDWPELIGAFIKHINWIIYAEYEPHYEACIQLTDSKEYRHLLKQYESHRRARVKVRIS